LLSGDPYTVISGVVHLTLGPRTGVLLMPGFVRGGGSQAPGESIIP